MLHPKHESFLDTLQSLVSKDVPDSPILYKKRKIEDKIDQEQIDQKARSLLAKEKALKRDLDHINLTIVEDENVKGWRPDQEKQSRKVATRGVIKLFNALKEAQKQESQTTITTTVAEKQRIAAASKDAFLSYLKKKPSFLQLEEPTPEII